MEKDPICGMMVDPRSTAGSSTYKGKIYYFCNPGCKATFEKNPAKYVK